MHGGRRSRTAALSIGGVSALTGIEIHTLRYWEKEFGEYLRPTRTTGGQRRYDAEAVDRILSIHRLLKHERYTIEGARNLLLRGEEGRARAA